MKRRNGKHLEKKKYLCFYFKKKWEYLKQEISLDLESMVGYFKFVEEKGVLCKSDFV